MAHATQVPVRGSQNLLEAFLNSGAGARGCQEERDSQHSPEDRMLEVADQVCRVRPGWTVGCRAIRRWSGRSVQADPPAW